VIRSWVDDGVGRVHIDDAEHRNVLSLEHSQAIAAAIDGFGAADAAGDVGAVVLSAADPVFCSGGVLDDLISPRAPLIDVYAAFDALRHCAVPTIAVVTGAAIGAGVNLPLACDIIVAGTSARFDPRFLDVGVHPGGGHLFLLQQRVGRQGAAALSLCGDALTGPEAERAGLAWRCVPDDEAEELAMKLARRAARRDRELMLRAKATLDAQPATVQEAFDLELVAQQWSMARPGFTDHVRALRDRLQKKRG
jgi:enoyl-CoA hydratase